MAKVEIRPKTLILIIILTLIPTTAFSASKITPGTKCKVFNQKAIYLNKTYTCLKSGKNLFWGDGVPVSKKSPTIASPTTPQPSESPIVKTNPIAVGLQDSLNFKNSMYYNVRDGQLIRRADSGTFFENDSRQLSQFDPIRVKAYNELNQNSHNREHPNVKFIYSISDSFPKFLVEYTKRELDEAAALWDSFIGEKINVNVFLVTEQDRENIKNNRWLQANLPAVFTKFDSRGDRPFISGGGGYWQGDTGWSGNIFLATASYLEPMYVNYEWPEVAKHEFVHLVQDYSFARYGRIRNDETTFTAIQLQNFREGSANTIAYLTAFRNIGWSNDALDWLIWKRAEDTKNWKSVNSLTDIKSLIAATDVSMPSEAFEQSYAVGALMFEWVIGTYGFAGYKKIINEFATVNSFSEAVQKALGVSKDDLYEQMSGYVYSRYQKVYSP